MRLIVDFPFAGDGIEEHQVFFKRARLRGNFAFSGESHAGAIKDQAVIAADLIHVNDGTAMVDSDGAQHLKPQASFVDGVRRGGDIQKNGSSLRDDFGDGVAIIAAIGPEILIVPDVFANGDAQLLVSEPIDGLSISRLKIADFIENVVGGQKHFALLENHSAFADERGFIGDGLCQLAVFHAAGVTHDRG